MADLSPLQSHINILYRLCSILVVCTPSSGHFQLLIVYAGIRVRACPVNSPAKSWLLLILVFLLSFPANHLRPPFSFSVISLCLTEVTARRSMERALNGWGVVYRLVLHHYRYIQKLSPYRSVWTRQYCLAATQTVECESYLKIRNRDRIICILAVVCCLYHRKPSTLTCMSTLSIFYSHNNMLIWICLFAFTLCICMFIVQCVLSEGASGYTLVMSLRSRKKDGEVYGFIPKTFKNTLYSKQHLCYWVCISKILAFNVVQTQNSFSLSDNRKRCFMANMTFTSASKITG